MKRIGCGLALLAAIAAVPLALIYGLWIVGGGNHRSVERRLVSPDGRFEARIQNDVRGSIQPIEWVVYLKPAGTRSDDPAQSCAVADALGEDAWRTIEPRWRGGALVLQSVPGAAKLAVRRGLAARQAGCAMVPVEVIAR